MHERISKPTLFVIAGEKSGDEIASRVLSPFKDTIQIEGVVGPKLKEIGVKEFHSIEAFSVMGLVDVIIALPRILKTFFSLRRRILNNPPKALLLVDNAEFSLIFAKSLRKKGFKGKIIQLVSPSVWAWRKNRIKTLEENFDLLLSIFPFEKEHFSSSSLKVEYVGHPLIEKLQEEEITQKTNSETHKPIIAIFPGSRKKETNLNLPLQLESVKHINTHEIAISLSSEKLRPLVEKWIEKTNVKASIVEAEKRYELMQKAEFALSKFGTINLELAYFLTPTITSFPLPLVEKFLLKNIFKVFLPHYSIVNILAKRRVFPEYVAFFATKENLKNEVENFRLNPKILGYTKQQLQDVKEILEQDHFTDKCFNLLSNLLLDI
jgi:lipid-A-disaccharide synthase